MPQNIVWTAYEHAHTDKGSDWFWAFGIVAVSCAIVAVLFKNFLFALLILIGAFTLSLLSSKPPQKRTFTLTPRGLMIDDALYPYEMLAAFWIQDRDTDHAQLIIDARRFMTPHIISPLENVDVEAVHEYLTAYLPEEEIFEPLGQRILEKFGI